MIRAPASGALFHFTPHFRTENPKSVSALFLEMF